MTFRVGYVVATHPEDHSVDLVMVDDGSRVVGAQVVTPNGSTRSGSVDMPAVPEKADKWDVTKPTGQDMKALVAFVGRTPVVTGFLYPQINQMLLKDPKTRIDRHQSDVLQVIDGDGNIDIRHPSGFAIRIGETPDHLNPESMNADGNLAQDRNTGRKPYMRITMADNAARITISPTGAIKIECQQTLEVDAQGAVTIKTPVSITNDTPNTYCTGNLTVAKSLLTGTEGGDATVNGPVHFIGPSVRHNDKNIGDTHNHGGIQPGGSNTAEPNS